MLGRGLAHSTVAGSGTPVLQQPPRSNRGSETSMNFGWDQRFVTETAVFTTTVKNVELINLLGQFEAETLRVLRDIPGLSVTAEHEPGRDVDALLRFAGTHTPIAVEVKHRANAATARQFVHQAETRPDVPFLLVAGETTTEAREILRDNGIAVLDGLGNAHIELPGLLFHLEGHRRSHKPSGRTPPTRLNGKTGVVAQALLRDVDSIGQLESSLARSLRRSWPRLPRRHAPGPSTALRCLVVLLHDGPLLDRMFLTDTRHLPDGRRQAGDRRFKLPRRTGQPLDRCRFGPVNCGDVRWVSTGVGWRRVSWLPTWLPAGPSDVSQIAARTGSYVAPVSDSASHASRRGCPSGASTSRVNLTLALSEPPEPCYRYM